MALQFVSRTHLFFSAGKDGQVKQWDADNFENVVTLKGHHGQVWTLAVSEDGKYVATAGHDRSIRLWQRTQEPLVLEDEREMEREAEAEQVDNSFQFYCSVFFSLTSLHLFLINLKSCSLRSSFFLQ